MITIKKHDKEILQATIDSEKAVIKQIKQAYEQALKDINDQLAGLISRADSDRQYVVYQKEYQEALQAQISGILDQLNAKEFDSVADYLNECYKDGFISVLYSLNKQGIPLIMPIDQQQVVQAVQLDSKISKGLYTRLGEDIKSLKKTISRQISRGLAGGMSYGEIARNIANSSRTGYNNGEIKDLDEPFSNGLMYPGDPDGRAAEVVNCRCALAEVADWALDEKELERLKANAEFFGLDKSDSFAEYKQKYLQKAAEIQNLQNKIKNDILSVEDVQDFAGLSDYMQRKYGITIDKSVESLDFESIKEGTLGIEKVMNEFPQAGNSFKKISTSKNGVMCAGYDGTINFNPSYYADRKKAVFASQSTGFHPKGNNVISTGSHEAGHILEKALIDKNTGGDIMGKIAWRDCTYAKAVVSDACKAAKKTPAGKGKRNRELIGDISGYAKTNSSETVAEAVADYIINGENASILSRMIWEILKKELG